MWEPSVARLSLAYQELAEVPEEMAAKYAQKTRQLDLSHNKIKDMRSLMAFRGLEVLVLDNNRVSSHARLPLLPALHTLWVNHNKISNLSVFIEHVATCLPKLRHLSMMDNEAAPSFFNGGSRQQYNDYRHFVISTLPAVLTIDDQLVTEDERKEANRIYGARRLSITPKRATPKKQRRAVEL